VRAPTRLNCRYLISAWSAPSARLHWSSRRSRRVSSCIKSPLTEALPFDAAAIYAPNPVPAGFPPDMLAPALPAVVNPKEPFDKLSDFWYTMDTSWKPVVDLVVVLTDHRQQIRGCTPNALGLARCQTTGPPL
jgi:hypothetical protein